MRQFMLEKFTKSTLQQSQERTARAVRCTKLQTRVLLFNGVMKLMEPLTVKSPLKFGMENCNSVA